MGFAGMDVSIYPGDAVMDDLIENTNLEWCGFYLGPAPAHRDPSWMDRRARLVRTGWGLAPIFVGQQDGTPGPHILTTTQGELDADTACTLAKVAGFPTGTVIYLDIEQGGPIGAAMADYLRAWADMVRALDHVPGVYCSHTTVASIAAHVIDLRFWVFKVKGSDVGSKKQAPFKDDDPSATGIASAAVWQWAQDCPIDALKGPIQVDLDTATTPDPSQP